MLIQFQIISVKRFKVVKNVNVCHDQEMAQKERNFQSKTQVRKIYNQVLMLRKLIVSRMGRHFPNRWPLSYPNLTKNMKTYIM